MKSNKFLFLALLLFIGTALTACRTKEETIAKIHVRNSDNEPIAGATVIIYGTSTTTNPNSVTVYDTTTTNSAGEAIFNFDEIYQLGQAGVAVLDISVQKDALSGAGIIKIEQETTSEETVFIQ